MELIDKVYNEYCNNEKSAERRYQFLLTMPKNLRPIEYDQVLKEWQEARKRYKNK